MIEEVRIVTRDVNGKRQEHYLYWDSVCKYVQESITDEDEILLVFVEDQCVYSGLAHNPINREDLMGFFA